MVAIAVAALAGPFGSASARPGQQAPPATATPHPPRPPSAGISGPLPACSSSMTAAPASVGVRVGDLVTITTQVRFDCPRLLERRAVLVLHGSLPASTAAGAGEALAQVVEGVARYGTSQVAVIDIAAPDASLAWASSADDLAALAARLRALEPRTRVSRAADWLAAFDTAERAVGALPPTLRPLLVVADGLPPAGDIDAAVRGLLDVVHLAHDAVGHSVLLGLAPEVWFELPSSLDPTFGLRAIIVRAGGVGSAGPVQAMADVLGLFQSPLTQRNLEFAIAPGYFAAVASEPPADEVVILGSDLTSLRWWSAVDGFETSMIVRVTLRAVVANVHERLILAAEVQLAGARGALAAAVVPYCIDPATPGPMPCDPTNPPTPTPIRPPPTPERPPPRLTEPSIVPPATGAPVDGARLWLPVGLRPG